jgi:hypothetical protein
MSPPAQPVSLPRIPYHSADRAYQTGSYWTLSRAPRYSVTFALPLVILYEVLAATLSRFAGRADAQWR